MTVLVTGATGFVGGHCVRELLEHGYPVRATVRDPARADVAHLHAAAERTGGSLELVRATLDDDAGWAEAVDGCEHVWHVASPAPLRAPRHGTSWSGRPSTAPCACSGPPPVPGCGASCSPPRSTPSGTDQSSSVNVRLSP
jgi:hypothetical protein